MFAISASDLSPGPSGTDSTSLPPSCRYLGSIGFGSSGSYGGGPQCTPYGLFNFSILALVLVLAVAAYVRLRYGKTARAGSRRHSRARTHVLQNQSSQFSKYATLPLTAIVVPYMGLVCFIFANLAVLLWEYPAYTATREVLFRGLVLVPLFYFLIAAWLSTSEYQANVMRQCLKYAVLATTAWIAISVLCTGGAATFRYIIGAGTDQDALYRSIVVPGIMQILYVVAAFVSVLLGAYLLRLRRNDEW